MNIRTYILNPTPHHQDRLLDQLLDMMADTLLVHDTEGVIRTCNPAAGALFGTEPGALVGLRITDLLPGYEPELAAETLTARRLDGTELQASVQIQTLSLGEESLTYVLLRDRSARRIVGNILRLAATVFENTLEGIIVTDIDGRIEYVNAAFTKASGYLASEVIGKSPNLMQSGWHDRDFYREMWRSLTEEGAWQGEIWNRRKSGEIYPQWLSIRAIRDEQSGVYRYAGVFRDISQHKHDEEQLQHQANHDKLTGLPNRSLLIDRLTLALKTAQRTGKRVGVLFIDLDRFKLINDTLGHNAGDRLLQKVAERLLQAVGGKTTVARIGGDEFTIVLEDIDAYQDALKAAQGILRSFQDQPFPLGGSNYVITPSIGIALYPEDGTDVETLVRGADTAMYRAKESSNTYQLYEPSMNAEAMERLELENDLHKALDREEFVVFYQPKVRIATGEVVGMEALVRWEHPLRGLVSPAEFIPLAEETGLIVPIGEWVLRTACATTRKWIDEGLPPLRLSVNLSARQFQQAELPALIADVLQATQLPADCLELEVTESIAMVDVEHATAALHQLKKLGLHISIDDFGTGYSSLSYLRQFPIQTLKIDKSFVRDIDADPDKAAIAASIIALAHSLQLQVIAEGVETEAQLEFLRERGCDEMQGFLFSGPVREANFRQLFPL